MRGISRSNRKSLARATLLAAGALALAACATGYSYVQPEAGGAGGYYLGDAAYPAPGYYDDDPYDPYDAAFGYGGLYGPSFAFGLGFGSPCGWSCAGYYGGWPWYYGTIGYYGHRRGHHHQDDPVASAPSPHPWLEPDHPRVPPSQVARGAALPIAVPERPIERLANRRMLESASFAPHGTERVPQQHVGVPDHANHLAPQLPAFVDRQVPSAPPPRDFARPPAPAAAPLRAAPPPARSSHSGSAKLR